MMVLVTAYSFIQPYKSRITNLLETAINVNFLLLLLINATQFFYEDMFTFPHTGSHTSDECTSSPTGVAQVSWLLMPVYYLPVVGACVALAVVVIIFIRYDLHVMTFCSIFHIDMYIYTIYKQ